MSSFKSKYIFVNIAGILIISAAVAACFIADEKLGFKVLYYCIVSFAAFATGFGLTVALQKIRFRERGEQLFNDISDFMMGGYIECYLDDELTIHYCSEKLYSYLGYSHDEFVAAAQYKMINLIVQEDRERVIKEYNEKQSAKDAQIVFDMIGSGERKISVIAIINPNKKFMKRPRKKAIAKSFIIDTMPFKRLYEEKDIDSERYRVVAEQSESIIFDYNIAEDTIHLNSNFEKKFGYVLESAGFRARIKEGGVLSEEDYDKLFHYDILNVPYTEKEVRVKKADGEYIWCKIRLSTIYDKQKKPARLIGKIIDVDASRKEKQQLIEKTKRDVLTGLYNRLATETLISEALNVSQDEAISAFILFDVDDFKKVNDEYGHIAGDEVLFQMTEAVRTIFRSTDIIGRIGGDEFVIFIKDIPNEVHAIKKARSVLAIVARELRAIGRGVSVSIGISMFPKDGNNYNELFRKADLALYASKATGKNTFTVYTEELENRQK